MCELCHPEGRRKSKTTADRLRHLADKYEAMAAGSIKPHTPAAKDVGVVARNVVRDLVEDWV